MNRRKFCQSAVCAAVITALPAALPARGEQFPYPTFSHDDTHPNMQFCNTVWWQYGKPDIMVADEIVIKQLQEAWRR